MLVIDRVELPLLDEPQQVRKLQRDEPGVLDQRAQAGGEAADIRHMREHVVACDQVRPAVPLGNLAPRAWPEEPDCRPDAAGASRFRHVRGRLDPEHRDSPGREMLQQVAVVARHLGNEAVRPQIKALSHGQRVPPGVRDPAVGVGREVGVVGEDILAGNVSRELHEQTGIADSDVQRIERFNIIQLVGLDIALAQRRHAQIHKCAGQACVAQSTRRLRCHSAVPFILVCCGAG